MFRIESFSLQLLKGYYSKKCMYVRKWTEEPQGMINYLALAWQNNFFPRILIIRGMTFKFEYLGEFEFIFENNLGAWSGAQEFAFDEKNQMSKISCKCTFNSLAGGIFIKHFLLCRKTNELINLYQCFFPLQMHLS
jgi:hypothetical protein